MKRKLTLTVEEELVRKGKVIAAKKGVSLSNLFEEVIQTITQDDTALFSEKWNRLFNKKNLQLTDELLEEIRHDRIRTKHISTK